MSGFNLTKRALFFLSLLLLSLWGAQVIYGYLLHCNNNIKASYKLKNAFDAEVIALGPSTVLNMFDPKSFEAKTGLSAYNLATNNSTPKENIAQLELYLQHNKKPRYILYEVSPRTFDSRYLRFNTWRFTHQLKQAKVRELVQEASPRYFNYARFPFMRYGFYNQQLNYLAFQGFLHRIKGKRSAHFPDGYEKANYPFDGDVMPFLKNHAAEEGMQYEWLPERVEELKELFSYIESKDITIFCYKAPVYDAVKPYLHNRLERIQQIDQLMQTEGIPYFNLDSLSFSQDHQYFFSCLHTNVSGTELVMDGLTKAFLQQKNN